MKRWVCGLLRVLGLASWLCAGPAHAAETRSESPPEVLEKAGALLGEMKEQGQEYLDTHRRRGMTAERRADLAQRAARKLAARRDDLAQLLPRLDPASEFAAKLGKFLAQWPDEAAFRHDLLADEAQGGHKAQGEIVSLWLKVPDRREKSKTLFPFFRP